MPAEAVLLDTVRRLRRELTTRGQSDLRATGDFERVTLTERDGDTLRDVLVAENARAVIEIGLGYGSSALAIAEALVSRGADDAVHVIIDAFHDDFHDAGWDAIVGAELTDMCSLERERSQLVLPRLAAEGVVADAAFVDGRPSVATAVTYFEVGTGWQRERLETDTRLRAYRLPDPRIEPSFEQFVLFGLEPSP